MNRTLFLNNIEVIIPKSGDHLTVKVGSEQIRCDVSLNTLKSSQDLSTPHVITTADILKYYIGISIKALASKYEINDLSLDMIDYSHIQIRFE